MSTGNDLASRDWGLFERNAGHHWMTLRRERGAQATFEIGARLRDHVRAVRSDWPLQGQREEDLAHHLLLIDILDRVPARGC